MIAREKIEEVLLRASIVDVISSYVPLKKRGNNFLGLCPFHGEKTPSFTVNEEKGLYHCFGCKESGNVIGFLMKHDNFTFPEAVKSLAQKYGIKIEDKKIEGDIELFYKLNNVAMKFFTENLNSSKGQKALAYLKERQVDDKTREEFSIGLSLESWDSLKNNVSSLKLKNNQLVKSGLFGEKDSRLYDRFRSRLIFPIRDIRGRVIAFGGRSLDNGEPKYLNSPETPIFNKSYVLYGIYEGKDAIKEKNFCIVVEGYFDVISLAKNGFKNTVATMGTALTTDHVRKLKSFCKTIYTLFDGDEAGLKATERVLPVILKQEMPCRVISMEQGVDPDDFIKAKGKEGMEDAIKNAKPIMEFYLENLKRKFDLNSPEDKGQYLNSVLEYILLIENVAVRGHYVSRLSQILALPTEVIYEAINKGLGKSNDKANYYKKEVKVVNRKENVAETNILKVILNHPEFFTHDVHSAFSYFKNDFLKKVSSVISSAVEEGLDVSTSEFINSLEDAEIKNWIVASLVEDEEGFMVEPERMLRDCLKKVTKQTLLKDETRKMIEDLKEDGHDDIAGEIIRRSEKNKIS